MNRPKDELDTTSSRTVYRRLYKRLKAKCARCPWHRHENEGRKPKHGTRKRNKVGR